MDYNTSSILPSSQPLPRWLNIIIRISASIYFIAGVIIIGLGLFDAFIMVAMGGIEAMLYFFTNQVGLFIVEGLISLIIGYGLIKHRKWTILFMVSSILIPILINFYTFKSALSFLLTSSPTGTILSLLPIILIGLLIKYRDGLEGNMFSNSIITVLLITIAIHVYVLITAISSLQ